MCVSNTVPVSSTGTHFENHCYRGTRKGVCAEYTLLPASFFLSRLALELLWAGPSCDPGETNGFTNCSLIMQHKLREHPSGVGLRPPMQALGAAPPPICVVLTALGAPARCRSHRFSLATLLEFPVPVFIVGYLWIVC